jgi:hypothetical protein
MSEFAIPDAPKAKLPAQGPVLAYNKPEWSAAAKFNYSFEILKNGTVVQNFEGPAREFITVGKQTCFFCQQDAGYLYFKLS